MNLLHTLYEPPGSGPHPTILALHGWGANALDLLGLSPYLAGGQFLVLCPQGPVEVPLGGPLGYGWFPITSGAPPDPGAFQRSVDALRSFLDEAGRRYPIDARKVVALGFSQGGVLAYSLALAEPERFAGLVALSSWLPPQLAEQSPAAGRDRLPTLIHHGTSDEVIPIERARESLEGLRRLGVPAVYREFAMGHEINAESLTDLTRWLSDKIVSPIILA
jgi:phospholipase/carboxylesterase